MNDQDEVILDEYKNPVTIHGKQDFESMRISGRVAASVLDFIEPYVKPGVSTEKLDELCHKFILAKNAVPAPLNYKGFPKSTCTSVNHVVCHGIPGKKVLKEGDIINIDITVILVKLKITAEEKFSKEKGYQYNLPHTSA